RLVSVVQAGPVWSCSRMRKCRYRPCRAELPPKKECAPNSPEAAGVCKWDHQWRHEQAKREASKPRTARVSATRKKRKPRVGDDRAYLQWVKTQPCVMCG